ncbi:MAG: cytochrome c biogenesis protein CcdA [Candidatus Absconditabacteria bacterium]|nr:cytochrome c biogenesis protein CcdA [Candidatus Absconditabacteria bacterium]MDD3868511.1 cytochrome c biogenesis protein CcdA [Candidatus Absconditabacteria bacterium]MDD4713893.1 cytochrome c biogenesis protein CcdA [Candidatus Absconditabacteria bacterium]
MSKIIKVVLSAVFVLSPLGVTLAQENIAPISTDRAVSTENEAINENPSANDASRGTRVKFFGVMLPAALADSINPCAFAVMLLLLTSILAKIKNRKKALLSGLMFALAVFITYFLLGIGVLKLLGNVESLFWLKWIVGIVGILVGLANLKDYFRYGKGFVMEVPMSWRPLMQKIIKKVTSPAGAFVVGIVVSLFLLPCSSGPYLTILGYLSSESQSLNLRGYIYLTVYNLIFILPMVIIAGLIGFGYSTAEKIGAFKNKNTRLIHLIVGLLMLGLGIYVIGSLYRR